MSFEDGLEFLALARELHKTANNSDAWLRTAISRYYYAIFLRARTYLKRVERITFPNTNVHQRMIAEFGSRSDATHTEIGEILDGLKEQRNDADYNQYYVITAATLTYIVMSVDRFFQLIEKLETS